MSCRLCSSLPSQRSFCRTSASVTGSSCSCCWEWRTGQEQNPGCPCSRSSCCWRVRGWRSPCPAARASPSVESRLSPSGTHHGILGSLSGLGLSTWFVWAVPGGSAPLSVPLGDLTVLCPGSSQEPRCLTWLRLALSCLPHSLSNRLHEVEEGAEPLLSAFSFQRLLSNLTSLRLRVSPGPVRGGWLLKTSMGPNRGGTGDIQQHQALEDERDCRECF